MLKKFCTTHLSDERINASLLDIHPVPANNFLNPPEVDAYIEELVNDLSMTKGLLNSSNSRTRLSNMCREKFLDVLVLSLRFGRNWMEKSVLISLHAL